MTERETPWVFSNRSALVQTGNTFNGSLHECTPPSNRRQQPPLDPFADLQYIRPANDDGEKEEEGTGTSQEVKVEKFPYSTFHCVGTGTKIPQSQTDADSYQSNDISHRPNFVSRTCWYRNLYYRVADQTFHYMASPAETKLWEHAEANHLEEFSDIKMQVSMDSTFDHYSWEELVRKVKPYQPWQPMVHRYTSTTDNNHTTTTTTTLSPMIKSFTRIKATNDRTPVFLLFRPFHSQNFGHLLVDDFLTLFSMRDLFRTLLPLSTEDPSLVDVPLFVELPNARNKKNYGGFDGMYRCSPHNIQKWTKCVPLYKRTWPFFIGIQPDKCTGDILRTGNWMQPSHVGSWSGAPKCSTVNDEKSNTNNTSALLSASATGRRATESIPKDEFLLLEHVLAGSGRNHDFGCDGDCSVGRGPQLYRFRNYLLQNLQMYSPVDESSTAAASEKNATEACNQNNNADDSATSSSSSPPPIGYITFSVPGGSSRPDQVHWFEKEIALARKNYGHDSVQVVNMANLTALEQANLMKNTAVLFTNHGGGSLVSLFLPPGAAVLIFWNAQYRYNHAIYESAGYFRSNWISPSERKLVNTTMALLHREIERSAVHFPNMLCARNL